MTGAEVYLQPALVLHRRAYRESSLLIDAITRDYGVVSLIAKGVRREKSRTAVLLQPFCRLQVSFLNKNELKTLIGVELIESFALERLALYCGFYVNELLQRLCVRHDACPELFDRYQACLQALSVDEGVERALRYFELDLLTLLGFGVDLEQDAASQALVQPDRRYDYQPAFGMVENSNGMVSGETLFRLAHQRDLSGPAAGEAKQLLRKMLDEHLAGRPLKSREVLANIIKYL